MVPEVSVIPSPTALHDERGLVNNQLEIEESMATSPVFDLGRFEHVKNTIWQTAPDDYLPIRLRQGEVIRLLEVKATQRIEDFVEQFFAEVLGKEKKVRLIYMGMLLLPGRTLGEYGIEKNGLIDSVVTYAPQRPQPQAIPISSYKTLDSQICLLAIMGVLLYGFWTLLYHNPNLFTSSSIFLLTIFSVVHSLALISRIAIY